MSKLISSTFCALMTNCRENKACPGRLMHHRTSMTHEESLKDKKGTEGDDGKSGRGGVDV